MIFLAELWKCVSNINQTSFYWIVVCITFWLTEAFFFLAIEKKNTLYNLLLQFKDLVPLIFQVKQSLILHTYILLNGGGLPPKICSIVKKQLFSSFSSVDGMFSLTDSYCIVGFKSAWLTHFKLLQRKNMFLMTASLKLVVQVEFRFSSTSGLYCCWRTLGVFIFTLSSLEVENNAPFYPEDIKIKLHIERVLAKLDLLEDILSGVLKWQMHERDHSVCMYSSHRQLSPRNDPLPWHVK